ncbi:MAG: Gfo/Idh/MocA family oxidoreductase [Bacteroidetes bacterium]|nr:Gfo/Idh/MocA family oxidoreductase [Bacteroidota bacterium]
MKRYKWGILAPGRIAEKFAEGLKLLPNAELWAVGSRDLSRATDFAGRHGFVRAYGCYGELAADSDLDVVYIASPHSHHHEHTMLCLGHGKHVICEKAFALNLREVDEMIAEARSRGLLLMEALWPPFQPSYREADAIISSGRLGKVLSIAGRFGFNSPYSAEARTYNLALGGGSLLDIGIYPVMDILRYMGIPDDISAVASFAPTGADDSLLAVLGYADGRRATAYSSFIDEAGVGTTFILEKGRIILERSRPGGQLLTVEADGKEPAVSSFNPPASGFAPEAAEVMKCLDAGAAESSMIPLSFSHDLMQLLDRIRIAAGIIYPGRD